MGIKEPFCSLVDYSHDALVNITLMLLITIGGIGFLVWDDIFSSPFKTYNEVNLPLDEPQYVDIVDYFAQMNPRGTRVYLRITDKYGTMRSHYYTVYIVKMQMTTNEDDLLNVVNDENT